MLPTLGRSLRSRLEVWDEVGLQLCASLLYGTGRVAEALHVLKVRMRAAQTMHRFYGAFELSGRWISE